MTNTFYFWLLPFSPAPNNPYHFLLQTVSKGCFTPSVSTSVFSLAPGEEDGKLYAEASLLEMGTGTRGLGREGARARGTIVGVWGSEWAHLPLRLVLGPSEDTESGPAPRTGCVHAELLCQQPADEVGWERGPWGHKGAWRHLKEQPPNLERGWCREGSLRHSARRGWE